jgi:PIN domain nuclease of toxin-antitoxin system
MKELVTDTHSFLWHLYSPSRLGSAARQAFATTDTGETRIYIPSLVVAEALMVVQKHRLPGVELDELVEYLEIALHSSNYVLSDLQARMVLDSHPFTVIPDIFDRLVVVEAVVRGLPLISRDSVIRDSGLVSMVWE